MQKIYTFILFINFFQLLHAESSNNTIFSVIIPADRGDPWTCSGHCYSSLQYHGIIDPLLCRKVCIDENDGFEMDLDSNHVIKGKRIPSADKNKTPKDCSKIFYQEKVRSKIFLSTPACIKDCQEVVDKVIEGHFQLSEDKVTAFKKKCHLDCNDHPQKPKYSLNVKVSVNCKG